MAQQIQDLRTMFAEHKKATPKFERHTMGESHQSHSKAETFKKKHFLEERHLMSTSPKNQGAET